MTYQEPTEPRNWSIGDVGWVWPEDVDETGCENRSADRCLSIMQHPAHGAPWKVAQVFVDDCDAEMMDDCRVISAAPDMLAALRLGLEWSEGDGLPDSDDLVTPPEKAFRAAARAAIAKAEGKKKPWKVSVVRTGYATLDLTVDAATKEEAESMAVDLAGNHSFSEHHSEYTVESSSEVTT